MKTEFVFFFFEEKECLCQLYTGKPGKGMLAASHSEMQLDNKYYFSLGLGLCPFILFPLFLPCHRALQIALLINSIK